MADVLKTKRGVIKGKLTRAQSYFDKIDKTEINDAIIAKLTERLAKVEPLWDEFNEIQTELEILNESNVSEVNLNAQNREEFEDSYFDLVGEIKAVLVKQQPERVVDDENMSISNRSFPNQSIPRSGKNECLVRLPTIKLPTFDGQYGNWLEFRDAFKALVDSNESLHNIQKFYYLRSSLEKDASQIIKAIEVSADNYKNAWQLLVDRYENKPLMIHNHIKAIFEHPNVNKESHTELRKLFDNVSKHLRSLQSLGENTDCWDRLIIYIITIKFDTVTRRDWESYKYENALPIMSDMYTFLKARCEVLEKLEVNKSERQKPQQQFNKKYASNSFVTSTNNYQCFYCSQDHGIYKCETFLALTINERIAAVKRLKLCSICLRNSHT